MKPVNGGTTDIKTTSKKRSQSNVNMEDVRSAIIMRSSENGEDDDNKSSESTQQQQVGSIKSIQVQSKKTTGSVYISLRVVRSEIFRSLAVLAIFKRAKKRQHR